MSAHQLNENPKQRQMMKINYVWKGCFRELIDHYMGADQTNIVYSAKTNYMGAVEKNVCASLFIDD